MPPKNPNPRAVVLLSGGMDSCVCAALAVRDGEAAAVHVSYGQRTEEREREAFNAICDRLGIQQRLVVRNEALRVIGGSALTDEKIAVPDSHEIGQGVPVTYVPFRNAHFLAVAVSWAEVCGAQRIFIGQGAIDDQASDWIGPVEHEHGNSGQRGGLHAVAQCRRVSIKPRPHILNVIDDRIDVLKHLRRRLLGAKAVRGLLLPAPAGRG